MAIFTSDHRKKAGKKKEKTMGLSSKFKPGIVALVAVGVVQLATALPQIEVRALHNTFPHRDGKHQSIRNCQRRFILVSNGSPYLFISKADIERQCSSVYLDDQGFIIVGSIIQHNRA